jgi:ribosomal protein L12E/L44/L45/RPP1/RPP2
VVVTEIHAAAAAVATAVTATAISSAATAAAGIAAAIEQKEYDNEDPDDVVVIKNIAETVHKYPPFAVF